MSSPAGPSPDREPNRFSVDTHLFRELGELLVGRDSTALVELIKNAYDADASVVTLDGQNLRDAASGVIRLTDNGVGMTADQFRRGFLRVAARGKSVGERRSQRYGRRYTGEKGIGRLAAHKLARRVDVISVAEIADSHGGESNVSGRIQATLDWDVIEDYETIDEVRSGIFVSTSSVSSDVSAGTVVELSRLRRTWSSNEIGHLVRQLRGFSPPVELLAPVPKTVARGRLLFSRLEPRDVRTGDPGFRIELGGSFDTGEEYWGSVLTSAGWILEIDASTNGVVTYAITPTNLTVKRDESTQGRTYRASHPDPANGPFFKARIFLREGSSGRVANASDWFSVNGGVRVFLEGFRVLPYGEARDDWLGLDFDYTRRGRNLPLAPKVSLMDDDHGEDDTNVGLTVIPNRQNFGIVLLTESGAPGLRSLVNREGFVPNDSYELLVDLTRSGIDLLVRARARATYESRQERARNREDSRRAISSGQARTTLSPDLTGPSSDEAGTGASSGLGRIDGPATTGIGDGDPEGSLPVGNFNRLKYLLEQARALISEIVEDSMEQSRTDLRPSNIGRILDDARTLLAQVVEDEALFRTVASVGTQLAAFTHELNGLLESARRAEELLGPREDRRLRNVVATRAAVTELRRALERQAAYLVDVVVPDSRRRRSRQDLSTRFDSAVRLIAGSAVKRGIAIENTLPDGLVTTPMFGAELTAILGNLLTNAVKAAGGEGKIRARGFRRSDSVFLVIENTGDSVDLSDADRWFAPFESSTTTVDPTLGQGMGLGLPISRMIVEEYGGSLKFVEPFADWATAVQLELPS